jgi:predicted AAA+ superfamily ATPase
MATGIKERLLRPPKQSFFLFGPRGSGKSTWVRQRYAKAHYIDLLDESRYQRLLAEPGLFADEIRALDVAQWVVVDEIQRLPNLLNEVHRAIQDRGTKFVLLGSSARKLKTAGTNLLAGRAITRHLHPFLPAELGAEFTLERALRFGTLPIVWRSAEPKDTLLAYGQTYLSHEIQAEALVRNLGGFARFLPIAALFHGQALNTASLARDAGVARSSVQGYIEILQDTLLAFLLPAFESRMRVRERRHPKLYWADSGVARAARKSLGPVTAEEREALFEGLIAMMLRAYGDYGGLFDEWFYWTPAEAQHTEVDFLLRRGQELIAIEAKSSGRFGGDHAKGLRAIAGLPHLVRRVVVYCGRERLRLEDGIDVVPFADFAAMLAEGSLWP